MMPTLAGMTEQAASGSALARLVSRRLGAAVTAGALRPELDAVLAGGAANPSLVRQLAPMLGWHAADLFVIAGLDLPEDLVPATGTKPWDVGDILVAAARLTPRALSRLRTFVESLPTHPPAWPPVPPRISYPLGPGEMLLRLLRNRNIGPYSPRPLHYIGDGPIVSYATMAMLGPGRTELTSQYVTAFAATLGVSDADLAAITGVPAAAEAQLHRSHGELAQLAWDARRLTDGQLSQVLDLAKSLQ
jgi:hypothetical protein